MEIVHNVDLDMSTRQAGKKKDYMYMCFRYYAFVLKYIFIFQLLYI